MMKEIHRMIELQEEGNRLAEKIVEELCLLRKVQFDPDINCAVCRRLPRAGEDLHGWVRAPGRSGVFCFECDGGE